MFFLCRPARVVLCSFTLWVDLCDYRPCVLVDLPLYPVLSVMIVSASAELRRCGRGGARKGGPEDVVCERRLRLS